MSYLIRIFILISLFYSNLTHASNSLWSNTFDNDIYHYCYSTRDKIYSKPYKFPLSISTDDHLQLFSSKVQKEFNLDVYDLIFPPRCVAVADADKLQNQIDFYSKNNYKEIDLQENYYENVFFEIFTSIRRTKITSTNVTSQPGFAEKITDNLSDDEWRNEAQSVIAKFKEPVEVERLGITVSKSPHIGLVGYGWDPKIFGSSWDLTVSKMKQRSNKNNTKKLTSNTNALSKSSSNLIQTREQEKVLQAEIKKEVAVAQVENKAQLTKDKALPVVKKVDDDVQKALKKITKNEKKKVELKPYLETVVVCTPPSERGSFKCFGPNGSFSGHPNQPKGYKTPQEVVTMNMKWSCPDQKRFASVNNHIIWGCGQGATGSTSSKDSSQGLPIPERATYYCKPKQIGCKNQSPTQGES